jgi:hypothetical protein
MEAFPSEQFQVKGFEPCRRGRADHLVCDEGLLCDERGILRLQHAKPTVLFEYGIAHWCFLPL